MSAPIRYIADGQAVSVWHGITAATLLRRCAQAVRPGDAA